MKFTNNSDNQGEIFSNIFNLLMFTR